MTRQVVYLATSTRRGKKWMVYVPGPQSGRGATVHFGAAGMSDYTIHKDPARKARYVARHRRHEQWGARSIATAGFWSRWLLWGEPTLVASIRAIERRFDVRVRRVTPAGFAKARAAARGSKK